MFKRYREAFRKAVKEHEEEWRSYKWYEKAGVHICGPVAYVYGLVSGLAEGVYEVVKERMQSR